MFPQSIHGVGFRNAGTARFRGYRNRSWGCFPNGRSCVKSVREKCVISVRTRVRTNYANQSRERGCSVKACPKSRLMPVKKIMASSPAKPAPSSLTCVCWNLDGSHLLRPAVRSENRTSIRGGFPNRLTFEGLAGCWWAAVNTRKSGVFPELVYP